jgi:hypothetical protein
MATLVDLTGYTYGVASAETSFEVHKFDATVRPSSKTYAFDRTNNKVGFAITNLEEDIEMEGDLTAASLGPLAFTFTTACTVANTKDYNGITTGDVFLDEIKYGLSFDGFKRVSASLSRNSAITA